MSERMESRTFHLEPDLLGVLVEAATTCELTSIGFEEILASLPKELTRHEINDLGIQIQNRVELDRPSWDGIKKGKEAENRLILTVGAAAALGGDLVTAKSAEMHLWSQGPIGGWLGAVMVRHEVRKQIIKETKNIPDFPTDL